MVDAQWLSDGRFSLTAQPALAILVVIALALLSLWSYRLLDRRVGKLLLTAGAPGRAVRALSLAALLRWLSLCLLLWMLEGWMLQPVERMKPELVVLLDQSLSMSSIDPTEESQATESRWDQAKSWLTSEAFRKGTENFRVRFFTVADVLEPRQLSDLKSMEATGSASDLGSGLQKLWQQHGMAEGGTLVISDGAATDATPLELVSQLASQANHPVDAITVGPIEQRPDWMIEGLRLDDLVFEGDQVLVEGLLKGVGFREMETARLSLWDAQANQKLDQIELPAPSFPARFPFQLRWKAEGKGERVLEVRVEPGRGETIQTNNSQRKTIQIRRDPLRVLLVASGPSYEFRFLKHYLERARQPNDPELPAFEVASYLESADARYLEQDRSASDLFPPSATQMRTWDVVVVCDAQAAYLESGIGKLLGGWVREDGGGVFWLQGNALRLQDLSASMGSLLPVQADPASPVPARMTAAMGPWRLTEIARRLGPMQIDVSAPDPGETWRQLKPTGAAQSPMQVRETASLLANDARGLPVMAMQFTGAGRSVWMGSDTTYRWRGFLGSDVVYERFWMQWLRWLARRPPLPSEPNYQLIAEPKVVRAGSPIRVELAPKDSNLLGTATPRDAVELQVTANNSPTPGRATEEARLMTRSQETPDRYRMELVLERAGEVLLWVPKRTRPPDPVSVMVQGDLDEQQAMEPRPQWMEQLSRSGSGIHLPFADRQELWEHLESRSQERHVSLPPRSIWNLPWIVGTLIAMLAVEWMLRYRYGNVPALGR
ncbi:MAG: hypothetical protein ACK56Q_17475 [Pirellulaceae bacterium]